MQLSIDRTELIQSAVIAGVTIATLALLGSVAGYWTWIWLAPPLEPSVRTQAAPASQIASAVGLFGNMKGGENLTAPTGISIRLLGIVAATEGRDAFAVVVLDGKQIVATREGGDIAAGIRLAEVTADHVVLDRNGVRESLAWPEKTLASDNSAQRVRQ
jgi:general secretion pathway protein C